MVFMPRKRNTLDDALWNRIVEEGECWLFQGSLDKDGYGLTTYDRRTQRAHRLAYKVTVGDIPARLVLDHLCRVRQCINPAHLEPVTSKENLMRGETHARRNADKTHCKHGHEFTEENTLVTDTQRYCRQCARDKQKRLNSPERRAYRAKWARDKREKDRQERERLNGSIPI